MRKIIIISLINIVFLMSRSLFAEEIILKSITPEEKDGQFVINIVSDKPAEFISYIINEPAGIVLEPIEDIFTNLVKPTIGENDLISSIDIMKDDRNKINSIIIKLKREVTYHLVSDTNLVSVYLTSPEQEKSKQETLTNSSPDPDANSIDQVEEEEIERIKNLNKLVAPTKLPPLPSTIDPYSARTRPTPTKKPPAYPRPNIPQSLPEE